MVVREFNDGVDGRRASGSCARECRHVLGVLPLTSGGVAVDRHYLPYALGGGYVLSEDVVRYVVRNEAWLTRYNNEDASLGVWLAPLNLVSCSHVSVRLLML